MEAPPQVVGQRANRKAEAAGVNTIGNGLVGGGILHQQDRAFICSRCFATAARTWALAGQVLLM